MHCLYVVSRAIVSIRNGMIDQVTDNVNKFRTIAGDCYNETGGEND